MQNKEQKSKTSTTYPRRFWRGLLPAAGTAPPTTELMLASRRCSAAAMRSVFLRSCSARSRSWRRRTAFSSEAASSKTHSSPSWISSSPSASNRLFLNKIRSTYHGKMISKKISTYKFVGDPRAPGSFSIPCWPPNACKHMSTKWHVLVSKRSA